MKRKLSIIVLFLTVVGLNLTGARAEYATTIRVNIPFAFQVGKQTLSPNVI